MAAPTVEDVTTLTTSGGAQSFAAITVTAGSYLVVTIMQWASDNRTYTVSSDVDGNFTQQVDSQGSNAQHTEIHTLDVSTGGSHTVTVTPSGSTSWHAVLYEVKGTDIRVGASSTFEATSDNHAHKCSSAGINTQADTAVFVGSVLHAGSSSLTYTNYTDDLNSSDQLIAGHRTSASALTTETGAHTTTGNARKERAAMLELYEFSAGGGGPPPGQINSRGRLGAQQIDGGQIQ